MTTGDGTRVGEGREVLIERVFNAPRALVWQAWILPEHFRRWYGPSGFTIHTCEIDFRVGGRHLFGMRSANGFDYTTAGVYLEIDPPARFVYTDAMADEHGNIVPGAMQTTVTLALEDLGGGRTKLTVRQVGWTDDTMAAGATAGWNQAFDKLAATLGAS